MEESKEKEFFQTLKLTLKMDGGGVGLKNQNFKIDCLTETFEANLILNSDNSLELNA